MAGPTADPLARVLAASQMHGHGIYLGSCLTSPRVESASSRARSGIESGSGQAPVFARPQHGVLLLGPPRSGKTATVVVPNVLGACGPVVAASTKADVLASTWAARSRLGPVMLYDPSGKVPCPPGVHKVAWSPLGLAGTWDGAVLVAHSMVEAARPGTDRGDASFWSERAAALLATAFHAGALDRIAAREMVASIDRRDAELPRAALARHGAERALTVLEGIIDTDSREQSGIWSTASGVLAAYRTDAAMSSTEGKPLDCAELLDGRGTLYICAGSDFQHQAAPLVAGLVREVRTAVYERSQAAAVADSVESFAPESQRDARPPLLLVLDELANIAPLHDLPKLVAEGASQGVVTLACLQDLAQARAKWGRDADAFMTNFGTKLVFPGIGDTRTLEEISLLAGEHEVSTVSVTRGARRRGLWGPRPMTRTVSTRKERSLPVSAIARGFPGCVLGIEGTEPGFLRATPWFSSSPFREAVLDARTRSHTRFGVPTPADSLGAALSGRARAIETR